MASSMYDVAVVGCGPVGALVANLAATAGLSVLVIDREATPHPLEIFAGALPPGDGRRPFA